jgi:hypothetical protein
MSIEKIPTTHKAASDVLAFISVPPDATDEQLIEFAKHLPESNLWHGVGIDDLRRALGIVNRIRERRRLS